MCCGLLAQLAEQLTLNQQVPGSSPGQPKIYISCMRTGYFTAGFRSVINPAPSFAAARQL